MVRCLAASRCSVNDSICVTAVAVITKMTEALSPPWRLRCSEWHLLTVCLLRAPRPLCSFLYPQDPVQSLVHCEPQWTLDGNRAEELRYPLPSGPGSATQTKACLPGGKDPLCRISFGSRPPGYRRMGLGPPASARLPHPRLALDTLCHPIPVPGAANA